MAINILLFIVAVLGVTKSADWFLAAAEKIGVYLRLPRFIMGVVLIGFGTSLPELTTSLAAVAGGESHIAIANILGSNIANILVIIGIITIVMGTVRFKKEIIDIDLPMLLAISTLFGLLVFDGSLDRVDGILLILGFVGYILYSVFYKDHEDYHKGAIKLLSAIFKTDKEVETDVPIKPSPWVYIALVGSVFLLGLLSKVAVDNLMAIVENVGIAVSVVSFFALAIGTSLPELVVSIKALKKGHGDLVIGNIIGSCMFNILLIGGVASILAPQNLSMPAGYWMIAGMIISTLLLVVGGITRRLHIWEGASFLLVYVALSLQII